MPVKPAAQVVQQSVSWLWQGRIALGKLLIMDGDPDLGKSMIALDLCARLSSGRPFPDGQASAGPANALVLSAEDTAHDTIVPRLQRLGADMQRVSVWQRDRDDEVWPWRFPRDADRLDDALARTDARLAVIDPIMAFLDDKVITASDHSVRRALAPLLYLADKHNCTLLMHRHLNKQGGNHALYRGLGSIAFVALCRYAMLVARDPVTPGRCVLAQVRNALAGPQPNLAYQLSAADGGLPTVDWLGVSRTGADQLLAAAPRTVFGPRERAAAFIEQILADGPKTSADIWQAAQKAGLAARTLQRAKGALNVRTRKVFSDKRLLTWWLAEGQRLPGTDPDDPVENWLESLDKQSPHRTPLDDDDDSVAPPPSRDEQDGDSDDALWPPNAPR